MRQDGASALPAALRFLTTSRTDELRACYEKEISEQGSEARALQTVAFRYGLAPSYLRIVLKLDD
jgi:hypothetical protein